VGTIDAIVDFAHTPDGLEKVLEAARSLMEKNSRLITLFGCPGSRDSSKRPMMGRVASERSDWVIVTTDDIHYEEPKDIAENIVAGIAKENFEVILDRREAIRAALKLARAGDYVLLAGRGHERFQYVGDRKVPFVDGEVLAEEAKRLGMEITRL
jgi:UDP-N-acetylmuramoyl-L-alanyl-D-glutamate--2,6-diaminopimelate ligase